jgi:hypothetical protein
MVEDNDYFDLNSDNEEYILEEKCGDSVDIRRKMKTKLLEKAEKAKFKINSTKNTGTGFFCKISFNNNKNIIKVLFINNHILNEESLQIGKIINIIYKGKSKDIEITNNRLVFTDSRDYNIGLDYSCIQIFDSDGIEDFYEIYNDNCSIENEIIAVSGYYNGEELFIKSGYLKNIENYQIYYSIDKEDIYPGSPIILAYRDFKIIGIHRSSIKEKEINLGSYIKDILNSIYEDKYKGKENEN